MVKGLSCREKPAVGDEQINGTSKAVKTCQTVINTNRAFSCSDGNVGRGGEAHTEGDSVWFGSAPP